MTDYNEKEMVVAYINARSVYEELKERSSEAYHVMQQTAQNLLEYMEDVGTTSTAKYDGLGRVSMTKPILQAKCEEANRGLLYQFLRDEGLSEVIKETIHPSTLSSIIKQRIVAGETVPEFLEITYRKDIRVTN